MINLSLYHIFKDKFDYLSFKNNRKVTISLLFFRLSLFSWLMHVSMLIFSNSKLGPAEMRNKDMQWWVCFFHTFFFLYDTTRTKWVTSPDHMCGPLLSLILSIHFPHSITPFYFTMFETTIHPFALPLLARLGVGGGVLVFHFFPFGTV